MTSLAVITPTYNERENLRMLVTKIFALGVPNVRMVVVDDNSPDGTAVLADELARQYPITVIHRKEKTGLGTAYVEAFKRVLAWSENSEYIVQMDADLSHDPAVIATMLARMGECDLVLGSRYVPGGKIENWDFLRRLVSRFGNLYARWVLWLPQRDLTGGFKCWRHEVLEHLDFDSLSSIGYNFQIETTYRAYKKGFRICEIPITFTERKTGVSKFNLGIIFESFWKVLMMRFRAQ